PKIQITLAVLDENRVKLLAVRLGVLACADTDRRGIGPAAVGGRPASGLIRAVEESVAPGDLQQARVKAFGLGVLIGVRAAEGHNPRESDRCHHDRSNSETGHLLSPIGRLKSRATANCNDHTMVWW